MDDEGEVRRDDSGDWEDVKDGVERAGAIENKEGSRTM